MKTRLMYSLILAGLLSLLPLGWLTGQRAKPMEIREGVISFRLTVARSIPLYHCSGRS